VSAESKPAVLAAMGANFAIAVGKFGAGALTGSAAMFAEAGHSVADTVNQVFLLVGINLSDSAPDEDHPHGYGKEAFFWSFLAAIFIFVAGAAFSFYEGARTLLQSHSHERSSSDLAIAFAVLGFAVVFEVVSSFIAVRNIRRGAKRRGWSFVRYLRNSPDLTAKTVFWEDLAALTGLVIAAAGLALSEMTGNEIWDGVASLAIGAVLTAVALMLGLQARKLLIGAAAGQDARDAIAACLRGFEDVERVVRMLTMQLGSHSILVTGELQLARNLSLDQAEALIGRIDEALRAAAPEVVETFWELKAP
jgi:cation diffusion facilitator family transporter